jgi:hypothetical protein
MFKPTTMKWLKHTNGSEKARYAYIVFTGNSRKATSWRTMHKGE